MSQSVPPSRPSKTKPADPQKGSERVQRRGALSRPLTERDGVQLRQEVQAFDELEGDRPTSWRHAVHRWRDYIRDRRGTAAVFENTETAARVLGGDPHRFAPEYADKQYAKLKDLERGLRDEYGKRLHTAMLTFTASSTDDEGEPLPPVDHLEGLLSSWEAVTRSLRRSMEGRRYERLAILEPHESGYLHVHMAVFVDGVVSSERFAPVVEAHLRNCDLAGEDAHDPSDRSTISVRHVGADRSEDTVANLGTYLAEYLGAYGGDPLDESEKVQMGNTVLWATGKRRWRPSDGAQEYMKANRKGDPDTTWEFVGIEGSDGEFHEARKGSGGVKRFTTGSDPPNPPDGEGTDTLPDTPPDTSGFG